MHYITTDTVSVKLALEIHASVVLMGKNGVDGVYTADPAIDKSAIELDHITYNDVLLRGLKVAEATAFSLCMDKEMPMEVFGMDGTGIVSAAQRRDTIGTLVLSDYCVCTRSSV